MTSLKQEAPLTLQENALATAMAQKIGDATVRFTIGADGNRYHQVGMLDTGDFDQLVHEFSKDPKESLAWARESLFAISKDSQLTESEKSRRLDRYLDAYFSLTLKLDRAAFPPTRPGDVRRGVPDYIPDGFVDMGGSRSLNPHSRSREMIVVDKGAIFERFKPLLKKVFSAGPAAGNSDENKKNMFDKLAYGVYFGFPHNGTDKDLGGGKVRLGGLPDGVCRHQALVFQTLAQSAGLTSRLVKNRLTLGDIASERHAANMVRVNHRWYMYDVTNPDYAAKEDGRNEWRPGAVRVDRPIRPGEQRTYEGDRKYSGTHVKWEAHDDMYWYVDDLKDVPQ